MNLSGISVLTAVVVAVVFGQQAEQNNLASETISYIQKSCKSNLDAGVNPNATLMLESGYINGTKCVAKSQAIITDAISKARDLLPQDPEAAKNEVSQSFEDARLTLFTYAIPLVIAYGSALELSNDGALGGFNNASKLVQRAGFSALDSLNAAEVLFVTGIGAGGNSFEVLLDACQLAADSGFAGSYNNLQKAIHQANQGLKDAQSNTVQRQVENRDCETAGNDTATSEAIMTINEAAINATQNGANADLVQLVKEDLICAIIDYAKITAQGSEDVGNLKPMAESDPLTFQITYAQTIKKYSNILEDLFSKIYILLGSVAFKAGLQPSNGIGAAILDITVCEAEVGMGIESGVGLVNIGVKYGGDAPQLAIDSGIKIAAYLEIAFIQAVVECAKDAFSAL